MAHEKSILDRGLEYVLQSWRVINGEESPRHRFDVVHSRGCYLLSAYLVPTRASRLLDESVHTQETPSGSETQSLSLSLSLCRGCNDVNKRNEIYGFVIPAGPSVGFSMRLLAKDKSKNVHGE